MAIDRPSPDVVRRHKFQLLLVRAQAVAPRQLVEAIGEALEPIAENASPLIDVEWELPISGNHLGDTAHAAEGGSSAHGLDALIQVSGPEAVSHETLTAAFERFGENLRSTIDVTQSCLIAGTEHTIMPGTGSVHLVFALRRLPSLSRAEFQDYWLNKHADFGRRNPATRYRQFHTDEAQSLKASARIGIGLKDYDGVAEAFYADLEETKQVFSSPGIAREALADERRFIDHSQSQLGIYQRK